MIPRRVMLARVADLVCVEVFAGVGRVSHGEDLSVLGLLRTSWPFTVGWMGGWALALVVPVARQRPWGAVGGVCVWVPTVAVGMALRALTGAGVQGSFVVVASIVLGALMLGWRGVAALVTRHRNHAPVDAQV